MKGAAELVRAFLLGIPDRWRLLFFLTSTVGAATLVAILTYFFVRFHQPAQDSVLTTSVYLSLGTTYAVLLAFAVNGVWQHFTEAVASVQAEADALIDLIHAEELLGPEAEQKILRAALKYARVVIEDEWPMLGQVPRMQESKYGTFAREVSRDCAMEVIRAVQNIDPRTPRQLAIFQQALSLLGSWLDARRKRLQSARGTTAAALWNLLIVGALFLFSFHGLFVTHDALVWFLLLLGLSSVTGLAFFLIFSLDAPFAGYPAADPGPFRWVLNWFEDEIKEPASDTSRQRKAA
ncbi:MAG TPA: hypothetical protein VFB28_03075 [Terriglobales bacterium]|nr:hypothetical protein [Terriglobales bacterium]